MAITTKQRLAIVGGGRGGLELIKLLHGLECVEIVGVADPNADAVGMREAVRLRIKTFRDFTELLKLPLDYVIEATRSQEVQGQIQAQLTAGVCLVTKRAAELLFTAATERQRRAIGDIRGVQGNIKQSTKGISEVMKTNLDLIRELQIIAINAAVEAARVGQAGMGFAVVANRIRELADAYEENSVQVHGINDKIKQIADAVDASLLALN
jgi:methyl-accepting chemotaxis protein